MWLEESWEAKIKNKRWIATTTWRNLGLHSPLHARGAIITVLFHLTNSFMLLEVMNSESIVMEVINFSHPKPWMACLISNCSNCFFAGISNNTILRTVERYDPQQDKWTNVSSLNNPRSGACAVVLMGKIFVMGGGSDFRKILSSCEIYDPGADKWSYGKGKYCKILW